MLPTLRRTGWIDSPFDALDREFGRALRRAWNDDEGNALTGAYPVDIREDDDHVYVDAEMPGFTKDQISVTLENGILQLAGQRKAETAKGQQHLTERRFLRVARAFTMPTPVDENRCEAKLQDGVLHLTFAKREEVKPRKIEVK